MPKKLIRKLQIGFGFSLFVLLLSSSASYVSIKTQMSNRSQVIKTQRTIDSVNKILIDLQNVETGQRGYLLTGEVKFLEPYYESRTSLPSSLSTTRELAKDIPEQSRRIDSIETLVTTRLDLLNELVALKKEGGAGTVEQLERGKLYMDSCRNIIRRFVLEESSKLDVQTAKMQRNSGLTSFFIIFAAFASLIITILFYLQIRNEFRRREKMQQLLREKDEDTTRRLNIVRNLAHQIADGDYSVRLDDDEKDTLGYIASSLNGMAIALEEAFGKLHNNEWRQTGLAKINDILAGNKTEESVANDALELLISYTECVNGAFYIWDKGLLVLAGSYGLEEHMKKEYRPGEGIVGQVFKDKRIKTLENLTDEEFVVSFSSGQIKVKHLLWLPLMVKGQCFGVIELGSVLPFEKLDMELYQEVCHSITLEILAAKGRKQIQTLLEETQAQAEELQTQHAELENLNTELEAQTQKLQASEEELRVQQEELMQSNQELEERSKLLEEKNQLVAERNLEIQKKAEELALSTKYKSEFLANMSHELRTPLNSILLLSRLMVENADDNLTDDQIESAKVIQSSGSSLLSLIDEILDLSKIEAGKMELEYEHVALTDLRNDLLNLFLPIVDEKGLALTVEIDEGMPGYVETDKLRVEQVLRNLLSNAIKFTPKGNVALSISQKQDNPDYLQFVVKDTGIGISPENQKIIFEAFQQADGSTRRKFGGTGLGLSISREIARLLGGEITVSSTLGEGSTFRLTIPNRKISDSLPLTSEVLVESITQEVEEMTALVADTGSPFTISNIPEEVEDDRHEIRSGDKVILIVEDDTAFAKALLKYAHQNGYKGVIIVRGDWATEAAEKYQPLAILLDIQLPVKDGWQVMDEIKSNPKTRHIPVHIMSSLEVKRESLSKGAIDFINKPIAIEQIGQMFRKIEDALTRNPKKVLIVEENPKHATALSYFLSNFNIASEIKSNVEDSIRALMSDNVNCVILDMGVPDDTGYETLEAIKQKEGLENLPIIIFTGKNLSQTEELKIKQYAHSIVIKTAHSFQRILDEVGLFLHLVEEINLEPEKRKTSKLGSLNEVLNGKTVLIADDDVRNIFSLTKTLEHYQMKIVSAIDGKEALQQLEKYPETSIILMDMMMPEMDGYETIRQIRNMRDYAKLPIIAVTAKAMTGDREKCIKAGASDYISKPVDKDQLLSLLRVWLYEN
ncbi:response regulator [Sphingobacterium corticibacterium]|uniref:histidine kinase n=1 Tax=Sphingobacterium corticibacterium TaxID=2484746 RepID=A0A4Q6XQE7_9SPHI|nr:response regulator [Sphingobacterium corticibacterium]RZF58386.1 response regulator [Sphingobacterium corticibacterium]